MSELNSKLVAELAAISERLAAAVRRLQESEPPVDAAVAAAVSAKVAKRICLACDRRVPADELYRRGLDVAHYNHALRLIEGSKTSEAELMAAGKLAPKQKTGKKRPGSSLDTIAKPRSTHAEDLARTQEDANRLPEKKARRK